jgi:hypothetical protein
MDRALYSIEETRARLGGISRNSLYAMLRAGDLQSVGHRLSPLRIGGGDCCADPGVSIGTGAMSSWIQPRYRCCLYRGVLSGRYGSQGRIALRRQSSNNLLRAQQAYRFVDHMRPPLTELEIIAFHLQRPKELARPPKEPAMLSL